MTWQHKANIPTHLHLATVDKKKLRQSSSYLPLQPMPSSLTRTSDTWQRRALCSRMIKISRRQQQKIKPSVRSFLAERERGALCDGAGHVPMKLVLLPTPSAKQEGYLLIWIFCHSFSVQPAFTTSQAPKPLRAEVQKVGQWRRAQLS